MRFEGDMQRDFYILIVEDSASDPQAISFCERFLRGGFPRYVFGCNEWGRSIAESVSIDGFVDDFIGQDFYFDRKVIRSEELPLNALVVSAVVLGRPLTALARIAKIGAEALDYFAFKKYSGLDLASVKYLDDFRREFSLNKEKYQGVYDAFVDEESRSVFRKIINFRTSSDLRNMNGFVDAQYRQYFEDFLDLKKQEEVFVDVGCFDGYTTEEFIKRCPEYRAVHVFEPSSENMMEVRRRLAKFHDVNYHSKGAGEASKTVFFKTAGSASMACESGETKIEIDRIDSLVREPFTFLKMDIEGGEVEAIKGAGESIVKYHPRLALSVYHKVDDFWRIPELVLSIRDDYDIYLRHYTEGVDETVMYFMPRVS